MKKTAPSFGQNVYPTETARRSQTRIGVTPFERCKQCGSVNDTRVAAFATEGEGLVHKDGDTNGDFTVVAGCWLCGSLNWRTRRGKLPDDTFLEDGTVKNEEVIGNAE